MTLEKQYFLHWQLFILTADHLLLSESDTSYNIPMC